MHAPLGVMRSEIAIFSMQWSVVSSQQKTGAERAGNNTKGISRSFLPIIFMPK